MCQGGVQSNEDTYRRFGMNEYSVMRQNGNISKIIFSHILVAVISLVGAAFIFYLGVSGLFPLLKRKGR